MLPSDSIRFEIAFFCFRFFISCFISLLICRLFLFNDKYFLICDVLHIAWATSCVLKTAMFFLLAFRISTKVFNRPFVWSAPGSCVHQPNSRWFRKLKKKNFLFRRVFDRRQLARRSFYNRFALSFTTL